MLRQTLTLLLILMLTGPYLSAQINIFSTPPEFVAPCGPAYTYQLEIVNESGAAIQNVDIAYEFPVGIQYVAGTINALGVSELDISNLNIPVFRIATLNDGLTTLALEATVNCQPGGGTDQLRDSVTLSYDLQALGFSGTTYNVNDPILVVSNTTNLNAIANTNTSIQRSISIVNSGFREVTELIITDDHPASILIEAINIGSIISTNPIEVVISGTDFSVIGNGDNLFDPGEQLTFEETVRLLDCTDGHSTLVVSSGCNNDICQTFDTLQANVQPENSFPQLEWAIIDQEYAGFCSEGFIEVALFNTGNEITAGAGTAFNISLNPGIGVNSSFPSVDSCLQLLNFQIGNYSFYNPIFGGQYLLPLSQLANDPDGQGGLEDLDGDGQYDDLAIGDTLLLRLNLQLSPICLNDICGFLINHVFRMRTQTTSQCQGELIETLNTYTPHVYEVNHPDVFDNLKTQYGNGEEFEVDFTFAGRIRGFTQECTQDSAVIHIVLPPSIVPATNFAPTFNGVPVNYIQVDDTLNLIVNSRMGLLHLNFQVLCEPPSGIDNNAQCGGISWSPEQIAEFNISMSYFCLSENCPSPVRLFCSESSKFIISCPSLSNISGVFSKSLDVRRISLGWTDEALTQKVDPITPGLELKTAMAHDFVQFKYTSVTLGTGVFDTSTIQLTYESPDSIALLEYQTDTLFFFDSETGQTFQCNNIGISGSSYQQGIFTTTFSILDLMNTGACLEGIHLTDGDSLVFKIIYQVTSNVPDIPTIIPNLGIAHTYINEGVYYDCGIAGGILRVFNPSHRFVFQSNFTGNACDPIDYKILLIQGNTSLGLRDFFPFEYRPLVTLDSLKIKLPKWTDYISGSSNFQLEYRENNTTSGPILRQNVSIGDPIFEQRGDENWLIFPDEKSFIVTDLIKGRTLSILSFQITPNCLPDSISNTIFEAHYTAPAYAEGFEEALIENRQSNFDFSVQDFTLNSINPLSLGLQDTLSWSFQLCNGNSAISTLPYTLLHLVLPDDGIIPFELVEVLPNNQIISYPVESFGNEYLIQVDTLNRLSCRLFELRATFNNCEKTEFEVFAHHYCDAYPTSIQTLASECNANAPSMLLALDPQAANLQVNLVSSPPSPVSLCEPLAYELKILNAGIGTALQLFVALELPEIGTNILDGFSEFKIGNAPYASLPDPVQVPGTNRYVWNLGAQSLAGLNQVPLNELFIRFQLDTDCDFQNLSTFSYQLGWEDICGSLSNTSPLFSLPFELDGAPQELNLFEVSASSESLNACASSNLVSFQLINQGGSPNDSTSIDERIRIELPENISFQAGSFQNLLNFPGGNNPLIFSLDSLNILEWSMPLGLGLGDSLAFSIELTISNPELLDCGELPLTLKTLELYSVPCATAPSNACDIAFPSVVAPFVFDIEKPILELTFQSLLAIPAPPTGEQFYFDLELFNNSNADGNGMLNIAYYYDINADGIFNDTIDQYAGQDFIDASLLIAGTTQNLRSNVFIPADSTCYDMLLTINQEGDQCLCNALEAFAPNVPIFSANPDTSICEGESISIGNAPITGYNYEWIRGDFLQDPLSATTVFENLNPLASNIFNRSDTLVLKTTRSTGCEALDTMIIQSIRIETQLEIDQIITCAGSADGKISLAINGGLAPLSFEWNPASDSTQSINQLSGGNYSVTVTDRIGCSSEASIMLSEPAALDLQLMPFDLVCNGTAEGEILITLTGGTTPYLYSWSNGDTSANLLNVIAGTYQLLLIDANGCEASATATLQQPPPIATAFDFEDAICFDDENGSISILEPVGAGYLYNIDNQPYQSIPVFEGLSQGEYIVGVRDLEGCTTAQTFTISSGPEILIQAPDDQTINLGDSVRLLAIPHLSVANEMIWTPNATLSCDICFDPTASPLQTTTYTISVINEEGCTDEDQVTVFVDADYEVFFPNIFTPNQDGINDLFTAFGNEEILIIRELRLFDRWGEAVFARNDFAPNDVSLGWDGTLNGEEMNSAVFVYYAVIEFIDGKVKLFEGDVTLMK